MFSKYGWKQSMQMIHYQRSKTTRKSEHHAHMFEKVFLATESRQHTHTHTSKTTSQAQVLSQIKRHWYLDNRSQGGYEYLVHWIMRIKLNKYDLSIILRRPPGNHKPISPVCSQPSSSTTSLLFNQLGDQIDQLNVCRLMWQQNLTASKRWLRLDFILVVALKNNRTSHANFPTRIWLIIRGVIHFRNIHKFYFWKEKNDVQHRRNEVLDNQKFPKSDEFHSTSSSL